MQQIASSTACTTSGLIRIIFFTKHYLNQLQFMLSLMNSLKVIMVYFLLLSAITTGNITLSVDLTFLPSSNLNTVSEGNDSIYAT